MGTIISQADVAWILQRLLPLSWMYRLARLQGRLVYLLDRKKRAIVARNLSPFSKDAKDLKRMTRGFFELRQVRVLMLVAFLSMDPKKWEDHFTIDGIGHLEQALSEQQGVILLGSHLNSIGVFMAIMILRRRGFDVSLALPSEGELYPPTLFGNLVRRRTESKTLKDHLGGFYVQFNVRPIVKRLSKNCIIGQTGDGMHSVSFTEVPFLNQTVPFTTGMMSVAQSTGAVVVPFNVVGEPPKLRAAISPPFRVPNEESSEEALRAAVASYAQILEKDLRENLLCWEHWLIDDTLETMKGWPDRPLRERYDV